MLVLFGCGTISQTYGVFFTHIAAELNVSMASVSAAVMIVNGAMVLCGPLEACLVDRFGMRRPLAVAFGAMAAALVGLSLSRSLAAIYLCYGACGVCMYLGMYFLCPYIVQRWFKTHTSAVIACIIACMAVGGTVGNFVLARIIQTAGWRSAYRCEAVLMLALMVLVGLFLRDDPARCGAEPYGTDASGQETASAAGGRDHTLKTALRSPAFYFLVLYVACMQFCVGMQSQIPNLALSLGLGAGVGALAASLNSFGGIPGKFLLAVSNEKAGVLPSILTYNLIGAAGALALLFLQNTAAVYLFAAMFGFAIGSTTVQLPILSSRLFGGSAQYGLIHARVVLYSGLLAMPSSTVLGAIFDRTGSYRGALALVSALMAAAAVFAALALSRQSSRSDA